MGNFEPWRKYPDLTKDRLSVIATIIRDVRHGCVLLHEPAKGDGPWGLGCRAYERTCAAIRKAVIRYDWLRILPETSSLGFSFAVGNVPFRFYRGDPDELPYHYQLKSYGEIHHLQLLLALDTGFQEIDGALRFAVETDGSQEVSSVTLVEVDRGGNPRDSYQIPFDEGESNVVTIETPPVDLPPVTAEPLKKEEGEKRKKSHGLGSVS